MPLSQIGAASLDGAQSGAAAIYGARAWVNFNGTGTVAIRGSGNVSSITDNGTGDYTVNFATAMVDADCAAVAACNYTAGDMTTMVSAGANTVAIRTYRINATVGTANPTLVYLAVFR